MTDTTLSDGERKLVAEALAMLPAGPWTVASSNSFRRINSPDGKDGGVLHAYTQRSDGHPDLSMSEQSLWALCRVVNAMPGLLTALEEAEGREAHLSDKLHEAEQQPWPAWADEIRKKLESYGVSPGGEEGWNLGEDFDQWFDSALETVQCALEDLRIEYGHTKREALELATWLHRTFYSDVTDWKPLEAASSIMTQIDNMMAGVRNRLLQAEADNAALTARAEKAEQALRHIANDYTGPLDGTDALEMQRSATKALISPSNSEADSNG